MINKKRATALIEKVAESANSEFVGRCYIYHVTPYYDSGFYAGKALSRCDMDGRNNTLLYVVSDPN